MLIFLRCSFMVLWLLLSSVLCLLMFLEPLVWETEAVGIDVSFVTERLRVLKVPPPFNTIILGTKPPTPELQGTSILSQIYPLKEVAIICRLLPIFNPIT